MLTKIIPNRPPHYFRRAVIFALCACTCNLLGACLMEWPVTMAVRIVAFALAAPGWIGMWIAALLTQSYFHGGYAKLAAIGLPFNFSIFLLARYELLRH